MAFEGLQPYQRQQLLDQKRRIAFDPYQVRQPFVVDAGVAEHADRQVAKARVLGQHGDQGFYHARPKAVADDDAVDVAGIEIAGGGLHAEGADQTDAFADGGGERRKGTAAAETNYGGFVEQRWERAVAVRGGGV